MANCAVLCPGAASRRPSATRTQAGANAAIQQSQPWQHGCHGSGYLFQVPKPGAPPPNAEIAPTQTANGAMRECWYTGEAH